MRPDRMNLAIARMQEWRKNPQGLYDFIASKIDLNYGTLRQEKVRNGYGEAVTEIRLSTGGWTDNEYAFQRLSNCWEVMEFWVSSHRGGHYVFQVPEVE